MEEFSNVQDNNDLRVLMLGGRRCGKTSVLASLFDSIVNGAVKSHLTVASDTMLQTKGTETQDSLTAKTAELKDLLSKVNAATFLVDQAPSRYWWDYRLKVQIPGTDREMFINFRDMPGEFCRIGNQHENEVKEYVKKCNVFIVVVDTPYMMEAYNPENELCSEGINEVVNRVPDIQQYLTNINDQNGQDPQMVIFCPVKCEKWYNEGRIDEVNKTLLKVYDTSITNLKAYKKMDISIIPVLTAGNIQFVEQAKAYTLSKNKGFGKPIRCCMKSEKLLRMADGKPYRIQEGDVVNEDTEAIVEGTNLVRPQSWFMVRYNSDPNLNGFKPVNCEQIPLHIIRFMLNKLEYENTHPTSIWDKLKIWFLKTFGSIKPSELKTVITKLQTSGIIKDGGDSGIVHIQTAF